MNNDEDFPPGTPVRYVPYHAHGDEKHKDCELGIVTSTNEDFIFVLYDGKTSSQATKVDQLVKL